MTLSRRKFVSTAVAGASVASQAAGGPAKRFVQVRGKQLVAPDGHVLKLRGINLGNWLEPEGYMFLFEGGPQSPREIEAFINELIGPADAETFWKAYRNAYITSADIRFIQRCGFNSVRLPLHWKFFVERGNGFELLDPVIAWCREAGLWVILDMHCAPGGQTGANIDDSWGYPWLYESAKDQELLANIWARIGQHYRDEPIILGYDLLNEPIPHFPQLKKYNADLEPIYKRVTRAIRTVDPSHIVILGGAQWDSNFDVFGPPFDSNLLYQLHKYWMPPTHDSIKAYLEFRDRYNVPIWLGESGENTDEWVQKFVQTLEENDIGWCFWPYKKMEKSSCVVSVLKPSHWDEIVALAKMPSGTGNSEKRIAGRLSVEQSRAALNDLLANIRIEKCRVNPGYIKALGLTVH
ncbi:MAG: cellulase family glycosylhydrolase [Acidobacteriaceae bacterium]|nr:cellulase family glycosylhydrolase [Acidobacteriaceae bacterium]